MGYLIFATVDTYLFVTMWYTLYQILFWPFKRMLKCCCGSKKSGKKSGKKVVKEEPKDEKNKPKESPSKNESPKKSSKKNKAKAD